jgi:hypothetical protein
MSGPPDPPPVKADEKRTENASRQPGTTTTTRRSPSVSRPVTRENGDYAAFAARVIRGHARRITDGDIDGLADLLRLSRELETATQQAVTGLRGFGYSWTDIGARLGTTRQAAQQRWGK